MQLLLRLLEITRTSILEASSPLPKIVQPNPQHHFSKIIHTSIGYWYLTGHFQLITETFHPDIHILINSTHLIMLGSKITRIRRSFKQGRLSFHPWLRSSPLSHTPSPAPPLLPPPLLKRKSLLAQQIQESFERRMFRQGRDAEFPVTSTLLYFHHN